MSNVPGNIKYLSGSLGKEEEVDTREESLNLFTRWRNGRKPRARVGKVGSERKLWVRHLNSYNSW